MAILVTGGAGYIGSHTCIELLNSGYDVVVVDNLVNSSKKSLECVQSITGRKLKFYEADLRDLDAIEDIFENEIIDSVIHFAGLKAVGESVSKPMEYYDNNIHGTLVLCDIMKKYNVKNMIFSSSATVYGSPAFVPITEECPKGEITNPYGQTKAMLEQILTDIHKSDPEWNIVLLRYFNPIGADRSGKIGEDPKGIPNNLVPYITQVAIGKLPYVRVYGNDYNTPDGTGVRDYIHVTDLARGHVKALKKLEKKDGVSVYNLGTGRGYSVLEVIHAFEKACGKEIPYKIEDRRPGDIASCYADSGKAYRELDWKAEYSIERMCEDSWRWQSQNPNGYEAEHDHTHVPGHTHDHIHEHTHGHHHHHEDTKKVLNRMSRAIGHMEATKRMVEDGRDCSEVLVQIAAVKSATNNIGKMILKDHINHCVVDAIESGDQKVLDDLSEAIDKFIK